MTSGTFKSTGSNGKITDFKITVDAPRSDGKTYPVVLLVHGNFGLGDPYGGQIHGFAQDLTRLGYVTVVPQYYEDDNPHVDDVAPHDQTLVDAIAYVAGHADVDTNRLGLIGFSLGATTSMTYIANHPPGTVKAFADFFGFLTPQIQKEVSRFPPTIILHNENDQVVNVSHSRDLDRILPTTIKHKLVKPYQEQWALGRNHAFKPGGHADVDSRSKATRWLTTNLPPKGL
jgi:carboxymethylenebutenolidase